MTLKMMHLKYTTPTAVRSRKPLRLFHGRRWGSWTFDTERLVLVHGAEPVMRGRDDDEYVAFLGNYEIDVERIHQSAQVLDWILQIRGKTWASSVVMRDLIEAFDDIFALQANLCSFGSNKIIGNPTAFLKCRIGTVGNGPQQGAARCGVSAAPAIPSNPESYQSQL